MKRDMGCLVQCFPKCATHNANPTSPCAQIGLPSHIIMENFTYYSPPGPSQCILVFRDLVLENKLKTPFNSVR